jgi:hypothetical protein
MKAIWSDDWDSSLSDDQEYVVNMCFIAIEPFSAPIIECWLSDI